MKAIQVITGRTLNVWITRSLDNDDLADVKRAARAINRTRRGVCIGVESGGGTASVWQHLNEAALNHPNVTTLAGIASSAASILWCCGHDRLTHANSRLLFHPPAMGQSRNERHTAGVLRSKVTRQCLVDLPLPDISNGYKDPSNPTDQELRAAAMRLDILSAQAVSDINERTQIGRDAANQLMQVERIFTANELFSRGLATGWWH